MAFHDALDRDIFSRLEGLRMQAGPLAAVDQLPSLVADGKHGCFFYQCVATLLRSAKERGQLIQTIRGAPRWNRLMDQSGETAQQVHLTDQG